MNEQESPVEVRARQLNELCRTRSLEHQWSHHRYRRRSAWLTGVGAVSGALAGGTLLSGSNPGTAMSYFIGTVSALGAIAVALEAKLRLHERSEAHQKAAISFGALGTAYYDVAFRQRANAGELNGISELTKRQEKLENNSLLPEPWAIKKQRRQGC
ncbi:hypothetical protein [Streptomyces roseolus]|uniref:hypothetical protein n=1 Tax=Streptomyces roseolus TaxID=67358 RepID=UPI0036EBF857